MLKDEIYARKKIFNNDASTKIKMSEEKNFED